MSDDERANVVDDAVSNRSDDTALEEGEGSQANGQTRAAEAAPEATGGSPAAEEQSSTDNEVEVVAEAAAEEAAEAVTEEEAEVEDEAESDVEDNSPAAIARRQPVELASDEPEDIKMDWYILKVQSNRERTIAESLERKMRIEGYDKFFDRTKASRSRASVSGLHET